jgi:Domain of unknown function (DUF4405)
MNIPAKVKSNTKTKLAIDILIFIGFLVAMEPRSTGIAIHEWLTLASMAAVITHLLLNWNWIVQVTKRFFTLSTIRPRINYILNVLLFIDVVLIMYTGIMISESFVPTLGIALPRSFNMRGLHDTMANLFILLLGLHTAFHWSWIGNTFKRYVFQPVTRLFVPKNVPQVNPVENREI